MVSRQPISTALIVGWLATSLAIVVVAAFAFPGASSGGFWLRTIFVEILSLVAWGSGAIYVVVFAGGDSVRRLGGIAPSFIILMSGYVALSLLCLLAHGFVAEGGLADRSVWIFQIVRTVLAVIAVVFLATARAGATANLAFDHDLAMSPRQLHDLLASYEPASAARRFPVLFARLKHLRETLLYSLNVSTNLSASQEYQTLSRSIAQLCSELNVLGKADSSQTDPSVPLTAACEHLTARVKALAGQLAVR